MESKTFTYQVHGITLSSTDPINVLIPSKSAKNPDLEIHFLAPCQQGFLSNQFEHSADQVCLTIAHTAEYVITRSGKIDVRPDPEASPQAIQTFLLGSALATALIYQGIFLLHANAVIIQGQAVLFMGKSGAGKSTTAYTFYQNNYTVLTDDVCRISFDKNGQAYAHTGPNVLRLCSDQQAKKQIKLNNTESAFKVSCMYWLNVDTCSELTLDTLTGSEKLIALLSNLYRPSLIAHLSQENTMLKQGIQLLKTSAFFKLTRPKMYSTEIQLIKTVLSNIGA